MTTKHRPHRGRLELVIIVLEGIDLKLGKTNIMYGAYTSGEMFDRYIKLAKDRGLVTESIEGRKKTWELTAKGKRFLQFGSQALKIWYEEQVEEEKSLGWRLRNWIRTLLNR